MKPSENGHTFGTCGYPYPSLLEFYARNTFVERKVENV